MRHNSRYHRLSAALLSIGLILQPASAALRKFRPSSRHPLPRAHHRLRPVRKKEPQRQGAQAEEQPKGDAAGTININTIRSRLMYGCRPDQQPCRQPRKRRLCGL
jgi:hypothetical protein